MKIPYRLGLDIGTNSIGWCVLRLDGNDSPIGIVRAGSRIFSDGRNPKDLASLAATRRQARQARRRHDRVLKRQARFMNGLIRFGLMPAEDSARLALSAYDPYVLRAKGLDSPLTVEEFGRALYHLAKRRGFKSSRRDQKTDEKEAGKIKSAIENTRRKIEEAGCRTLGEYLAKRHSEGLTTRARLDGKGEYILYSQRSLVAEEFDLLWRSQVRFQPTLLSDEARDFLRDTLLFQRPLLPIEPGRCIFEPEEYRIPQCSPLQQKFRILQELNNLRVHDGSDWRGLTLQERNTLRDELYKSRKVTFANIRGLLGLRKQTKLNLETGRKSSGKTREFLNGDYVSAQFASEEILGNEWHKLTSLQQEALAVLVESADKNEDLTSALIALPKTSESLNLLISRHKARAHYAEELKSLPVRFTPELAERMTSLRMPEDHGGLSRKALEKIVAAMDAEVMTYDRAVLSSNYQSHSSFYQGEIFNRLPYYGEMLKGYTSPAPKAANKDESRWGKLPNPTVHIGLNQLRLVVNEIIRRWGPPREIIVELAREFGMSGKRRNELLSEQTDNQKRNEGLNERLRELGQRENRENRQRLQLYFELGKDAGMSHACVYSGAQIGIERLFSADVEIDHILPFSKSLDDSLSNKVLCLARANREKRNRTPHEAFGHSPGTYSWDAILERAQNLPPNKAKRFKADAMEAFMERSKLSAGDLAEWGFPDGDTFLARHLTDTAYLSRMARQYLVAVCPPNKVWSNTGRLTAQLRKAWGLNDLLNPEDSSKNRDDHRHHALDAAVVAVCNRSTIQKIAQAARHAEDHGENRKLKDLPHPWPSFRNDLASCLGKIVVSHKADHGPEAGLHNDTNYGKRGEPDKRGAIPVSHRVPLESIKDARKAQGIADPLLRQEIIALLDGLKTAKEASAVLSAYSERTGIRRVHMLEQLSVIPIHDRMTGAPYRFVKGDGNYCYEIWREGERWDGAVITSYDANQATQKLRSSTAFNGKPIVMRLRKGDMLKLEHEGRARIMRVAKFSEGVINLVDHQESNVDARNRADDIDFSYFRKSPEPLRKLKARAVGVDPLGYVNDSGFKG